MCTQHKVYYPVLEIRRLSNAINNFNIIKKYVSRVHTHACYMCVCENKITRVILIETL